MEYACPDWLSGLTAKQSSALEKTDERTFLEHEMRCQSHIVEHLNTISLS